jgi:hypothetical protein
VSARHAADSRVPVVRLAAKRRRVKRQSKAVAQHLRQSLLSPGTGDPVKQVAQLRKTLQSVRRQVLRDGAGSHTRLVAEALRDLDHSLAKLSMSIHTVDPNTKLMLVGESKHALDRAQRKAKAAGHDWPL